jgi:hypothetical protein
VIRLVAACALALLAGACASPSYPVEDYAAFYEHQPTTILVVPVVNETTSAEAPGAFQSTIASPLLQRGYYIFPVLPTIEIMHAEGVYEGEQVLNVPPARFRELLGADAVLYVTLHQWDTSYMVLASGVTVSMTYELVDTATGETLWKDEATRTVQSDSSGGLIAAVVSAAMTAVSYEYVDLARQANTDALLGLPAGPLHPDHAEERESYMRIAEEQAEERAKEAAKQTAQPES